MGDNVSQGHFNSHLTLIHQSIRDSNERANDNSNKMFKVLTDLQRESGETRVEILLLTKENTNRLDNHLPRIHNLEAEVKELNIHKTRSKIYWGILGFLITATIGAVIKIAFSYLPIAS